MTTSTPASAAVRPSPVSRSTPAEREISTTWWPRSLASATVDAPAVPVAPATAICMMVPLPADVAARRSVPAWDTVITLAVAGPDAVYRTDGMSEEEEQALCAA